MSVFHRTVPTAATASHESERVHSIWLRSLVSNSVSGECRRGGTTAADDQWRRFGVYGGGTRNGDVADHRDGDCHNDVGQLRFDREKSSGQRNGAYHHGACRRNQSGVCTPYHHASRIIARTFPNENGPKTFVGVRIASAEGRKTPRCQKAYGRCRSFISFFIPL